MGVINLMAIEPTTSLSSVDRKEIEAIIEHLIGVLDFADGDIDMEDDDPAGGNVEDEGEADFSLGLPFPVYGVNQDTIPLNDDEIAREWRWDNFENVAFRLEVA